MPEQYTGHEKLGSPDVDVAVGSGGRSKESFRFDSVTHIHSTLQPRTDLPAFPSPLASYAELSPFTQLQQVMTRDKIRWWLIGSRGQ